MKNYSLLLKSSQLEYNFHKLFGIDAEAGTAALKKTVRFDKMDIKIGPNHRFPHVAASGGSGCFEIASGMRPRTGKLTSTIGNRYFKFIIDCYRRAQSSTANSGQFPHTRANFRWGVPMKPPATSFEERNTSSNFCISGELFITNSAMF